MNKFQDVVISASRAYKSGAFAFHVADSFYAVTCLQCCAVIDEKMHIDDLMPAIRQNSGRGGVLCDECRNVTCDSCGLTFNGDCKPLTIHNTKNTIYFEGLPLKDGKGQIVTYNATVRLCTLCNM